MGKVEKLELKHLVGYLPYGLKAKMLDYKIDYVGREFDIISGVNQWSKCGKRWTVITHGGSRPDISHIIPLLRPLSDLTKEIDPDIELTYIDTLKYMCECDNDHDWMAHVDEIGSNNVDWQLAPYHLIIYLLSEHFDIHCLIESGLAIDINTVK